MLRDVEDVAVAIVEANDKDDIIEVGDDDQSHWTLDQITLVITEEEL